MAQAAYLTIFHCATTRDADFVTQKSCTTTVQIFVFPARTAPFLAWACAVRCHYKKSEVEQLQTFQTVPPQAPALHLYWQIT